ncbi:hypothetical protein KAX17_11090 [Candidatus Bipolaricaulota bacterium]|nr:hypothetical protein [Candidatus Bipolaricaulota bacterium]MCK4599234.1 hypothetical protein [Candidatus Bipolaricaulota bacterium]
MSNIRPRKIDSAALFRDDWREDHKFSFIEQTIQPVVVVRNDGTFEDPDARVVVPAPLVAGPVLLEADGLGGADAIPAGAANEIVEIRSVTFLSAAGGNYALQDDGVQVTGLVAIGLGATGELIDVNIPVAGGSLIGVLGGLIGDTWNIRGVRL